MQGAQVVQVLTFCICRSCATLMRKSLSQRVCFAPFIYFVFKSLCFHPVNPVRKESWCIGFAPFIPSRLNTCVWALPVNALASPIKVWDYIPPMSASRHIRP